MESVTNQYEKIWGRGVVSACPIRKDKSLSFSIKSKKFQINRKISSIFHQNNEQMYDYDGSSKFMYLQCLCKDICLQRFSVPFPLILKSLSKGGGRGRQTCRVFLLLERLR